MMEAKDLSWHTAGEWRGRREGVCVEGCHGVILTPQCWCGTYGNSDCNRHSAGAGREGGAGGHSWYHQEDETTEDEDGPDTCKPHSCSPSHPHVAPPTSLATGSVHIPP